MTQAKMIADLLATAVAAGLTVRSRMGNTVIRIYSGDECVLRLSGAAVESYFESVKGNVE